MANDTEDTKRIDQPTGTEFVGHEWDGIEELDTPMPRWWLWTFYATIVWGIAYTILYPAWPLLNQASEGVLGWTSRGQLAEELQVAANDRTEILNQLAQTPIAALPHDPDLMRQAVAGGSAAFKVNCVQCHGAGAAGSPGYPNLNDDEWLWGGDIQAIEYTLVHGIRWEGSTETRTSLMPGFGDIFDQGQIGALASHVLSFRGEGGSSDLGVQLYADNCAACHGTNGAGDRAFGAPALNDAIWLYGSSQAQIESQIRNPSHGVMPGWGERLDPVTIKMLAAYVYSRGGGEATEAVTADPEIEGDEQP